MSRWTKKITAALLLIGPISQVACAGSESWDAINTPASSWRGFNLGFVHTPPLSTSDFQALRATGANLARLIIQPRHVAGSNTYTLTSADWAYMDTTVAAGTRLGFRVVITLAPQPGGDKAEYWNNPIQQASIATLWSQIAQHFKGNTTIAGFDLINEPVPQTNMSNSLGTLQTLAGKVLKKLGDESFQATNPMLVQARAWQVFAERLIQTIRQHDPKRTIIVEPAPWARPDAFNVQPPLPYRNIIYSFHFYDPPKVTGQGINGNPMGVYYPSGSWNQVWLSKRLEPVLRFAQKYSVPIYVGEFSIVRWAPGNSRDNYLKDLIPLFESQGWPWTYQAFREYQGWSAELSSTLPRHLQNPAALYSFKTGAMQILKSYFQHNTPISASSVASPRTGTSH